MSEKFKRIASRTNKESVFKTRHTLWNPHMRTRPIGAPQKTEDCMKGMACECGRNYIGQTARPWAVRLREHRRNLQVGHLERSRLSQHSFEENHRVLWEGSKILKTEKKSVCRKYKEAAYVVCLQNPISRLSVEISPIWHPLIRN